MRKLSDRRILALAMKQWEEGRPVEPFENSVRSTAWFLWLLVAVAVIVGGLVAIVLLFPQVEEHCDYRPGAGAKVECTQGVKAKAGRERDDVGHVAMVSGTRLQEYVREVSP